MRTLLAAIAFALIGFWHVPATATQSLFHKPAPFPGLHQSAQLVVDRNGVTHVFAAREDDLYFLQGWVHARDRFFQMDQNRRLASGTLAELLGSGALPSDVQLRTIGLRRAAERSLAVLLPGTRAALSAYARGVNAWLGANPLPPEYAALELTRAQPWNEADSVVIGKLIAFSLSFDLDIDATVALKSYVAAGAALGFDGEKLFSEDLNRSAPFDPAATVPDASVPRPRSAGSGHVHDARAVHDRTVDLAREYLER